VYVVRVRLTIKQGPGSSGFIQGHGINRMVSHVSFYQMELAIIDRIEVELDWLISQSNSLEE